MYLHYHRAGMLALVPGTVNSSSVNPLIAFLRVFGRQVASLARNGFWEVGAPLSPTVYSSSAVPLSFLRRFLESKPRSTNELSLFGTSYGVAPKEVLSSKTSSARDLCNLFGATSYATVVDGDQPKRYNVSVIFGGLNNEELQGVATIGLRSHGFRNLTADEVTTLATITRMEEFRREDRFL